MSVSIVSRNPSTKIKIMSTSAIILTWQHLGRIYEWNILPSVFLEQLLYCSRKMWKQIGIGFGEMSAFINLDIFTVTLCEIIKLIFELIISPLYFIGGYVRVMNNYRNPYLVSIGSIIIVGFFIFLFKKIKKINFFNRLYKYLTLMSNGLLAK